MMEFLSIVMLVFGILQIILFFKIWGMTNDVSAIESKIGLRQSVEDSLIREAQLFALSGDVDNAKLKYQRAFYLSVIELYEQAIRECEDSEDVRSEYYKNKYKTIVAYFEGRMKKIGQELDKERFDSFAKVDAVISKI